MLKKYRTDLHLHSCVSPCAGLDMTPSRIVRQASETGLDIIAVSDHNSAEHVPITREIAHAYDLTSLPAMEITTFEEVHILAVFDEIHNCLEVQKKVYASIPVVPSYVHDKISQPVVNEKDEILFFNGMPLINATDIPLTSLIDLIHSHAGIAIACHIDRETFGILSQLGFIPDGLPLDAVEISYRVGTQQDAENLIPGRRYPVVSFSDAHYARDIGRRVTEFYLKAPTLKEISLALTGEEGRGCRIVYDRG